MLSVLIVGNEGINLNRFENQIDWHKFEIDKVYNSQNADEALGLACKINPDIIVSDIKMPQMNGIEMCQKIRKIHRDVQFVFFDDYLDKKDVKDAMFLGAVGCVEKSAQLDEVEEILFQAAKRQMEKKSKNETLHRLMLENQMLLTKRLVEKLCMSEAGKGSIRSDLQKLKLDWRKMKHFSVLLLNQRQSQNSLWMSCLIKIIKKKRKGMSILLEQRDETHVIAVCAYENEVQMQDLIRQVSDKIEEACKENVFFTLSVGNKVEDMSAVWQSYQSAKHKMQQASYLPKTETVSPGGKIVLDCVSYIQEHYNSTELTLEKLAEYVYLSPNYLSTLFRRMMGMTVSQYISNVRISHAKEFLEKRNLKIYDVAYCCGYKDANYFAKVFKKMAGISPCEYRTMHMM